MDTKLQKYILLNDRVGEHLDKGWLSSKTIPTQLLRGEIFECLPKSKQPYDTKKIALLSFGYYDRMLECSLLDVSKITDSEADLLLAVSSTEERFRFFRERNRLSQMKSLIVGSKVFVRPKNSFKEYPGIIWYIGPLPICNGTMFGVELLGEEAKRYGTCDGTFRNRRYFDCPQDRGVFVAADKLRPHPDHDKSPNKETIILPNIKDIMQSFSNQDSSAVVRNMAKERKLKIDKRVVVFLEDAEPLRGTVRFIPEKIDSDGHCPVGIELDERKGAGTGAFKGVQRFVSKKDYALFAPITTVMPEEDFDGTPTKTSQNTSSTETGLCSSQGYYDEERKENEETVSTKQRSHELELSLATERQAREETERRLHSSEQRSHEIELSLATERQAREETERLLHSSEQRSHELELSLIDERQAHEETKRHLRSFEQRSHELELSVAAEKQTREQAESRLQSSEQRLHELEISLTQERQTREETETRLRVTQQRLEEFETSLVEETQAHQETESRLQRSEERLHELENTLSTLRQANEAYQRSREATRDWIVSREEVRLSDNVIGVGAWGAVKEGTFRGCKVAVKEIHQLILSAHNRRLFEREMKMASVCRNPCLLQFIGATNDDESPLFVTELLDTSLRAVLHERSLEPLEITTIALDVATGLNYLHLSHPAPIIHRDISSANVLLWKHGTTWRAKVSDYGTANFLQQSMTVSPGAVVYSAPEAQTSRQSPKLDVYSFGVLLCEMNVREMPDVDSRDEQIALVTNSFFRNLIRRCLQQNPEDRPTMAEIIESLENSPQ